MNKAHLTSRFLIGLTLFVGFLARPATAAVRLPAVIGDHMVLQQKTDAPIWGWANPGEKVQVKASWSSSSSVASADENGHWKLALRTPPAGGPFAIEIKGENQIVLTDVLVGERSSTWRNRRRRSDRWRLSACSSFARPRRSTTE